MKTIVEELLKLIKVLYTSGKKTKLIKNLPNAALVISESLLYGGSDTSDAQYIQDLQTILICIFDPT